MSSGGGSKADHDLLARLNALKKTHIDFDDKQYRIPITAHIQSPEDATPAKALHGDLLSRFNTLNGTKSSNDSKAPTSDTIKDGLSLEEDSKTIEELLNELGGEGAWNLEKDEATQIDELLNSANFALKESQNSDAVNLQDDSRPGNTYDHDLPSIDIEVSKPDPDLDESNISEDEAPRKSRKDLEAEIDHEADDIIAKIKDELKHAPPEPDSDDEAQPQQSTTSSLPTAPAFDLSTTPSKDLEAKAQSTSDADDDLASRFASLNLPSAPPTNLPSAPSSKPSQTKKFGTSARYGGHTEDEIDSWCIICLEDATLRCIGCDGDLYCAKCWIEGHKGPDAGYEERTHKAVEYNKRAKKEPKRRVAA